MLKSEVLAKILEDYTNGDSALSTPDVQAFCEYAAAWLSSHGVVGLGMAQEGMALRFADGKELLLFVPPTELVVQVPQEAINITGNSGSKITKPIVGDSASFGITGR
jgi:hypothetical protein